MKKSLQFIAIICFSLGQPVFSQDISNSHLEQIKRMGRTTTHITKKYEGTIEKMLFSGHKFGGPLDGIALRLKNNKLMVFRLLPFLGQSIGPYIQEGQEVKVLASGDKLLLNKVLHKDLAMVDLERDLGGSIQGIGTLKEVQTSTGTYVAKSTGKQWFNPKTTPILDAKVKDRVKLADYEGMLVLENDDTLIYQFNGRFKNNLSEKAISYLRASKTGSGLYYNSPNIYRVTSGNLLGAETAGVNMLRGYGFGNNLLRKSEVTSVALISGDDGLINSFSGRINGQKLDTFYFNSKSGLEIEGLIAKTESKPISVYYQEMPNANRLRAISNESRAITIDPVVISAGPKTDYDEEKVSYRGKISKINYTATNKSNRFQSLILDDSIYFKVDQIVMLSIVDLVKEGSEIEIQGWKRKNISSEINKAGYTIIVPEHVLIDDIRFMNRTSFSSGL